MSGDTADLIERAAKRKDALEAVRLAALERGSSRGLRKQRRRRRQTLRNGIGKAKTGCERGRWMDLRAHPMVGVAVAEFAKLAPKTTEPAQVFGQ